MENFFKKLFKNSILFKKPSSNNSFQDKGLNSLSFLNSMSEFKKDYSNFVFNEIKKNNSSITNLNSLEQEVFNYFCSSDNTEDFILLFNDYHIGKKVLSLIQSINDNNLDDFKFLFNWKKEKEEKDLISFSNETSLQRLVKNSGIKIVEEGITDLIVKKNIHSLLSFFNKKTEDIFNEFFVEEKLQINNLNELNVLLKQVNKRLIFFIEKVLLEKDNKNKNILREVRLEESNFFLFLNFFKLKFSIDLLSNFKNINSYIFQENKEEKEKEQILMFFSSLLEESKKLNLNKIICCRKEDIVNEGFYSEKAGKELDFINSFFYLEKKYVNDFFVKWNDVVSRNRGIYFFNKLDFLALENWKKCEHEAFNWISNRNYQLEKYYSKNPEKIPKCFSLKEEENPIGLNWIRAEAASMHKFDFEMKGGLFIFNNFKKKNISLRWKRWNHLIKSNSKIEQQGYAFFADYFLTHLKSINMKENVAELLKEKRFSEENQSIFEAINLDNYSLLSGFFSDVYKDTKFSDFLDNDKNFNLTAIKEIERINQDYIFFVEKEIETLKSNQETKQYDLDKFFLKDIMKKLLLFQYCIFLNLEEEDKIKILNDEKVFSLIVFDEKIKKTIDDNKDLLTRKNLTIEEHIIKDAIKEINEGWFLNNSRETTFNEIEKVKIKCFIDEKNQNTNKKNNFRF